MAEPGALDLDFLTQVVNVHWGGGTVFVYAELAGNKLHYVQVGAADAEPTKQTITLPEPALTDDTSFFGITGSSYAKVKPPGDDEGIDTLLVCGLRSVGHYIDDGIGNIIKVFDRHAMIYISNNGLEWREVRHQVATNSAPGPQSFINVVALVWDSEKKKFYYDQNTASDQIFSSDQGASWAIISSTVTDSSDPSYKSAFTSFCESNDCKDGRGQNVPDGVMANDVDTNGTAKPTKPPLFAYEQGVIHYTPGEDKLEVKREEQNEDGSTTTVIETIAIPSIKCITCVAGINGIFMAGGFVGNDEDSAGAVVLSTDGGKTWKPFDSTETGVVTMVAVPKSDI